MTTPVFSDNVYGTLASGIGASDTALTLTAGHGVRFPTLSGSQFCYATLINSSNVVEQIHITAHAAGSDSITVSRAANGTTAKAWNSGDRIELRLSSEFLNSIVSGPLTNSLAADVALNDTAAYFTGPTVAQGTTGTWFVSGTVTLSDTAGAANFSCQLTDGTTVIASARTAIPAANGVITASLSGYITNPAGNLRISVKDTTSTSGLMKFNSTGLSMDSTLSAFRIA